jgi:hypothetical protein
VYFSSCFPSTGIKLYRFAVVLARYGSEQSCNKEKTMNKTILRTTSLIMAIALTLGSFSSGQAKAKSGDLPIKTFAQTNASGTLPTIVAEADARVPEAKPGINFGTDTVLYVDGGAVDPDIESYIRFTVMGISGTVSSAKLRVYVTDATRNGPALYTTSNTWTETGITWNNRPARTSAALEDKGALAASSWVDYNVTQIITGNGTYSFILATDAADLLGLSSREGSAAPQLVITLPDATNTTLPTATPTTIQPTATLVAPTITPTTVLPSPTAILPTATAIQPTATPTTVSVQPTATTSSQTTSSTTTSTTNGGMWISSTELMRLPISGTAWNKIRNAAYGSWGTADLKDQNNKHTIYSLAGALVYARTDDPALRSKVRNAIIAAKRSLDESAEWQTTNGVLAAGRQIGAYVISADLINLKSYDAATDNEFRAWLGPIRTTDIGTHGRWTNIRFTCENATANWSAFACASRIAASIYLGDNADVQRSSLIIRALLGERSAYPADAPGNNGYFQHTAAYQSSWVCDDANWTGANPSCVKSGVNIDGVLVEDASRGGGCCVLQGDGIMYSWEALQGFFVSAELLYRTGNYGNPYTWSNNALKRTLDFMQRSGWAVTRPATYVPWMANARYGTSYPVTTGGNGRIMSWGDWLYQN